jgi:hypothetical protein
MSKMRRRKVDDAIKICGDLLAANPRDQAVWYLKCRALTAQQYVDDTEMEEEVCIAHIIAQQNTFVYTCSFAVLAQKALCATCALISEYASILFIAGRRRAAARL